MTKRLSEKIQLMVENLLEHVKNLLLRVYNHFVDIRYIKVILIISRDMVKRRVRKRVILQPSRKPTL